MSDANLDNKRLPELKKKIPVPPTPSCHEYLQNFYYCSASNSKTARETKDKKQLVPVPATIQPLLLPQRLFQFSAIGNQQGKRPKCFHLLHPLSILFTVLLHGTIRVTNTWILTHDGERHNTRSFICTPWEPLSLGGHPLFILYHMSH